MAVLCRNKKRAQGHTSGICDPFCMPLCPLKTVNQGVTGSSPVGGARFLKAHCRAINGLQGAFAVSGEITKRRHLHDIFIKLVYVRVVPAALKLKVKRQM